MMEWGGGWGESEREEGEQKARGESGQREKRANVARGWRDEWRKLEKVCEKEMKGWCERGGGEKGVDEMVAEWVEVYERVVEEGVGWKKRRKGGARRVYDREIAALVKEMREVVRRMVREGSSR